MTSLFAITFVLTFIDFLASARVGGSKRGLREDEAVAEVFVEVTLVGEESLLVVVVVLILCWTIEDEDEAVAPFSLTSYSTEFDGSKEVPASKTVSNSNSGIHWNGDESFGLLSEKYVKKFDLVFLVAFRPSGFSNTC